LEGAERDKVVDELSEDEEELSAVAVLLSLDFMQEATSTGMLIIRTNQENKFFISPIIIKL
jgi:hypothetical protein|tara:strand:+ start:105 stop:287 length:183 start_codon:yes stop_codon:yes gene_type:complete